MHTDPDGIVHPVTLKAEVESADVHYAACDACGARWAGPFTTPAMAARVAELANADALYDLPGRCRVGAGGPCCKNGVPVEAPVPGAARLADDQDAPPLHTQVLDVALGLGKGAVLVAFLLYTTVRGLVGFVLGTARFLVRLGWWSLAIVVAVAVMGHAVGSVMPAPGTLAPLVLGGLALVAMSVLVAVLGRRVLADLRAPAAAPNYSTPLTTQPGGATVEHVSTTPADGKPQGVTGGAAGTRQP
jgi:hypothetical protein